MKIAKMHVRLLAFHARDEIKKAYVAARTCYSGESIDKLISEAQQKLPTDQLQFVVERMKEGHLSIAEHITLTFVMEGFSRTCSHQLVRHRPASYAQRTQRWSKKGNLAVVIPPTFTAKGEDEVNRLLDLLSDIAAGYDSFLEDGLPQEDARFVLANATATTITMTLNLREFMHICNERLCHRAQWEIRGLVQQMKKRVTERIPSFSGFLVPKCEIFGFCREKKSCGRKPQLEAFHASVKNMIEDLTKIIEEDTKYIRAVENHEIESGDWLYSRKVASTDAYRDALSKFKKALKGEYLP